MKPTRTYLFLAICASLCTALAVLPAPADATPALQQTDDPNPPDQTIKLIFIHHSTGENWLRDDYGGLGLALSENNYFVSDTNYGWGPDSIGDRTDIPNWTEWFASEQTPVYMEALFNENEQHADYTRSLPDPGGENQAILFKSCFPNSALEGNPDDPPDPEGWLTVGHAKYVYNQILEYFATRPDKLFIVITAPPLSDGTYADNARAINDWLVNDWLAENAYQLPNVAVFDFYNVLTARDAHHWYQDGTIEHIATNRNTLHYPSGDDHPSEAGSRKATEEFLPLLNIYFHRWQAGRAQLPPAVAPEETPIPSQAPAVNATAESGGGEVPLPPETVLSIDDFEGGADGWTAFRDEATSTTVSCAAEPGTGRDNSASLRIDFSVTPGSWATCAFFFDSPQDWSAGEWLAFDIHSEKPGQPFNVILYSGTPDNMETYIHLRETPVDLPQGYVPYTSFWRQFLRVEWEANGGSAFEQPGQVSGLAFGFDAGPDTPYTGGIWIDNLRLEKSPTYSESENPSERGLPCLASILLPILLAGFAWLVRRE